MPGPAMIEQQPFWAAALAVLVGSLLWLWRGFSVGVKIGVLVQEVKDSRLDIKEARLEHREDMVRIENRLGRMEGRMDGHIDKGGS